MYPAIAGDRCLDGLARGGLKPWQQDRVVGVRRDAEQCVAHLLVREQLGHVGDWAFHVREQQHLVDVLAERSEVEQQRSVVFDPALGEPARWLGKRVYHRRVLVFHQRANGCIGRLPRIGLRRHVAPTVGAERRGDWIGGHLVEEPAEHPAVRGLRERLGFLQQIPHALHKVPVRLRDDAAVVHALQEGIPFRGVHRAVLAQRCPLSTKQQLALVRFIAGMQQRVQQRGVPRKGVASQFVRDDRIRVQVRLNLLDQRLVLLEVHHPISAVAVGGFLDGLKDQARERSAPLPIHRLCPLLDAHQPRHCALQPQHALLAWRNGAVFAGDHLGYALLFHARQEHLCGVLAPHLLPVHLHHPGGLGDLPDRSQQVAQRLQLVDGQRLVRLRVLLGLRDDRLQALRGDRVEGLHHLQVVAGLLGLALDDAVLAHDHAEHGNDGRVAALRHLSLHARLDVFLKLLARRVCFVHRIHQTLGDQVVQELVLLRGDRIGRLAGGGGCALGAGSLALGRQVELALCLQLPHRRAADNGVGESLARLQHHVLGDARPAGVAPAGVGALAHHLVLRAELGRQSPRTGLVVHGCIRGSRQCFGVRQLAVALQHAPVRAGLDHLSCGRR